MQGWGFHEVNVGKVTLQMVAAAAILQIAEANVQAASIALAGIGSHSIRLPAAEKPLVGAKSG